MKNRTFVISLTIIGICLLAFSYIVNAEETGWASPENFYYVYNEFNNAEEAMLQDDTYAQSDLDSRADEQDWYEFDLSEVSELSGCPVINGIVVEFDAYAGGSSQTYEIKLTWNSGVTWTGSQISSSLALSDTDTYIAVGGSTFLWGRTWDKDDFIPDDFGVYFHHNAGNQANYLDHIRVKVYYTLESPNQASCVIINLKPNQCNNNVSIKWIKGSGADYTLIKYGTIGYPTLSTGTQVYNGTGATIATYTGFDYCSEFYIGFWSWNTTYCSYSGILQHYWVSPCNNNITKYENIINASGYHQSQYNCFTGWKVWANYSSAIVLYQNIVNATGTHEYVYSDFMEYYKVWANYTGNETGGDCELKYLNFTDNNITINITYWGCNSTNTSNYEVNEDNWLEIAGFSFESGELGIIIVFLIFSLAFFVDKEEKKNIWKPILFFLDVPIAFATGVNYLGNTSWSIEWWIGIFMFMFAILLSMAGLYYGLHFGRKR